MFLGLPDPLVADPDPSLSHKSVERSEIIQNCLAKNLILIIKHIFTILKLLNFIY